MQYITQGTTAIQINDLEVCSGGKAKIVGEIFRENVCTPLSLRSINVNSEIDTGDLFVVGRVLGKSKRETSVIRLFVCNRCRAS